MCRVTKEVITPKLLINNRKLNLCLESIYQIKIIQKVLHLSYEGQFSPKLFNYAFLILNLVIIYRFSLKSFDDLGEEHLGPSLHWWPFFINFVLHPSSFQM